MAHRYVCLSVCPLLAINFERNGIRIPKLG